MHIMCFLVRAEPAERVAEACLDRLAKRSCGSQPRPGNSRDHEFLDPPDVGTGKPAHCPSGSGQDGKSARRTRPRRRVAQWLDAMAVSQDATRQARLAFFYLRAPADGSGSEVGG